MGEEISIWEFSFSNGGFLYSIVIIWEFSFSNGGFLYSIVIIFLRLFSCVLSGPVSEIAIEVPAT